jgi:hypothetical protein
MGGQANWQAFPHCHWLQGAGVLPDTVQIDSKTDVMDGVFIFDIWYVKGKLNKVADTLSHYYQFDSWDNMPLVQHHEVKNRLIETCSVEAQARQIEEKLMVLWERIEERQAATAIMAAAEEQMEGKRPRPGDQELNPSMLESRAKDLDLRMHMSEHNHLVDPEGVSQGQVV